METWDEMSTRHARDEIALRDQKYQNWAQLKASYKDKMPAEVSQGFINHYKQLEAQQIKSRYEEAQRHPEWQKSQQNNQQKTQDQAGKQIHGRDESSASMRDKQLAEQAKKQQEQNAKNNQLMPQVNMEKVAEQRRREEQQTRVRAEAEKMKERHRQQQQDRGR